MEANKFRATSELFAATRERFSDEQPGEWEAWATASVDQGVIDDFHLLMQKGRRRAEQSIIVRPFGVGINDFPSRVINRYNHRTDSQFRRVSFRNGNKTRMLCIPRDNQMEERRAMLHQMYKLDINFPGNVCYGIPERSHLDGAYGHIANDSSHFYELDLQDAFMHINLAGLSEIMAQSLPEQDGQRIGLYIRNRMSTGLVPGLPQGSPESPFLFANYFLPLYRALNEYCESQGIVSSYYFDNFTFSSQNPITPAQCRTLRQLIEAYPGAVINQRKTKHLGLQDYPVTLGIVSIYPNGDLGPSQKMRRNILSFCGYVLSNYGVSEQALSREAKIKVLKGLKDPLQRTPSDIYDYYITNDDDAYRGVKDLQLDGMIALESRKRLSGYRGIMRQVDYLAKDTRRDLRPVVQVLRDKMDTTELCLDTVVLRSVGALKIIESGQLADPHIAVHQALVVSGRSSLYGQYDSILSKRIEQHKETLEGDARVIAGEIMSPRVESERILWNLISRGRVPFPNKPDAQKTEPTPDAMGVEQTLNDLSPESTPLAQGLSWNIMFLDSPVETKDGFNLLQQIPDERIRQQISEAFEIAEVYQRAFDLRAPSPKDLASAGVDFVEFSQFIKQEATRLGCDQEIAIVPELSSNQIINLYELLANDQTIPNNPLRRTEDGSGMYWYAKSRPIHDYYQNQILSDHNIGIYTDPNGIRWTLSAIPAMERPTDCGRSYTEYTKNDGALLPTLSSYSAVQVSRLVKGLTLLDEDSFTMLRDSACSQALCAGWRPSTGLIYIYPIQVSEQSQFIGVRSQGQSHRTKLEQGSLFDI